MRLKTILIPASVTEFGEEIFKGITPYLTIFGTTGSGAETYVNDNFIAFQAVGGKCGDTSIHSVRIQDGVTTIGSYAFYECSGISGDYAKERLPDTLLKIVAFAFRNCTFLEDIFIPENVTAIERYAFAGCDELKSMYFAGSKETVMSFGTDVYAKTDKLIVYCRLGTMAYIDAIRRGIRFYLVDPIGYVDFQIPRKVTVIEEEAFAGISASVIDVNEKVISIQSRAFADNPSLEKIIIPDSCTYIADDAFSGCSSVLMIYGHEGCFSEQFAQEHGFYFALAPVG